MPQFFASTATGITEILEKELQEMGMKHTERINSGVFFESNWEGCYKVNLRSRLASRVLKPILDFPAYEGDEIYNNILKHDFTKYIRPEQTIRVESSVTDCKIRDQRFVALKVKDAIVDQFRDKFGVRPDVAKEAADLVIVVKAFKNQFHVSIDTTGESLFRRGYRVRSGYAPIKENLAAGLIQLSGWDRKSPLVDPFCGSGTFLIEGALMALNISPGTLRKHFAFMGFQGFQKEVWENLVEEAMNEEIQELDFQFLGFDTDRRVIGNAKENAVRAGVDHVIRFKHEPIMSLKRPFEGKGLIITNPPYGIRPGEEENLRDVYRDMGHTFKTEFKGWSAWILSGNKDLILDMKLKSTRKHFVYNGPLECRFLNYDLF